MILTCPNCATRFFAGDEAIGVGGRRVKCAACGEVWTGMAASPADVASGTARDEASPGLGDNHQDDGNTKAVAPLFVERPAPGRAAKRRDHGRPWVLGLVAVLFLIVVGGLVFRSAIERTFPGSANFYRSLGMRSAGAER